MSLGLGAPSRKRSQMDMGGATTDEVWQYLRHPSGELHRLLGREPLVSHGDGDE